MQALKAAVVIMGVLLLAGTAVIAVTIIHRLATPDHRRPAAPLPGRATIALPPGARLEGIAGTGDHVVLRLIDPQGRELLMVLDPSSGAVAETITLQPTAPPPAQPQDAR